MPTEMAAASMQRFAAEVMPEIGRRVEAFA
jgi:hypothetical protein